MARRLHTLSSRFGREDGQAVVEYTLVLGLVTVVALAVLRTLGGDVNGVLTVLKTALDAVPGV